MKTQAVWLCCLLAGALSAGCSEVTPLSANTVSMPAQWSEHLPVEGAGPTVGLSEWWRQFNDPLLDDLVARARDKNRDLHEAVARIREARAGVRIAESRWLPQLDADAGVNRARLSENGRIPIVGVENPSTLYQAGFDASWELDLFGSVRNAVAAARADLAQSTFARDAIQTSVTAEVVRQYVELRASQSRLEVRRRQGDLVDDSIKLTRSRFQAGLTSEGDEWRARELRSAIAAQTDLLEAEVRAAAYRLAVLCGEMPAALLGALETAAPVPSSTSSLPQSVPADLLTRRPDLKEAAEAVVGADARRRAAATQAYPSVSLLGNLGLAALTTSAFGGGGSLFWAIGPAMSWPIFTGGRVKAQIEGADAHLERTRARYEKAVLTAVADVEEAAARLQHERKREADLEDAITADRKALRIAEERYTRGLTDYLPVLDAQRQLYMLEDQHIASARDASIYLVALYKALGGGT